MIFIKTKKAFSLIELIIVIGIFSILTTLLIANYQKFGSNISLSNLAYDTALSIREAQTYGLATLGTTQVGNFGSGSPTSYVYSVYGFHIEENGNTPITSYKLFSDNSSTANHYYDPQDTVVRTYTFPARFHVKKFCGTKASGEVCSSGTPTAGTTISNSSTDSIDVTFMRPNPDAIILTNFNGSESSLGTNKNVAEYYKARVCIESDDLKSKTINILNSGQIEVIDGCI